MKHPTYRQWQAFRERLPLPCMLLCIHCEEHLDWRALDVARRGKRDGMDRVQATAVRVGAQCKVMRYEWYIPSDGTSEDIVESWQEQVIPFHASGMGCPDCQVLQASADAEALYRAAVVQPLRRRLFIVPYQFDPVTNLRLPTSVSTRSTYVRAQVRHSPGKPVAYIDVTEKLLEQE